MCLKNTESYEEMREANIYLKKRHMCACAFLRCYRNTEIAPAMEEREMEESFRPSLVSQRK